MAALVMVVAVIAIVLVFVLNGGEDVPTATTYDDPADMAQAAVSAGVTCTEYREDFSPANPLETEGDFTPYATSAGRCLGVAADGSSEELIFSIYDSTQQRDAQATNLLEHVPLPGITRGVLVGPNWLVNCSDACEGLQTAIGGELKSG